MSVQLCGDVLYGVVLFSEDPFGMVTQLRLICQDWNYWTSSQDFLQKCVIATLKRGWAIRNEPSYRMTIPIQNKPSCGVPIPFQVDLFRIPSVDQPFKYAAKYNKLVRNHLEQFTIQSARASGSLNYNILPEPKRVKNEMALQMSAIIAPFIFLTKADTRYSSYDRRFNEAKIVIANVKGDQKFVHLKYEHGRGDYPGHNESESAIELIEFETNSSREQVNEEISFVLLGFYISTQKRLNTGKMLEIMEFIGLGEEYCSH